MPRPSACIVCGCFTSCMFPEDRSCAERLENPRKPMYLVFEKEYYCDQGVHSGQMYVQLHGYLTHDQLERLKEFIQND